MNSLLLKIEKMKHSPRFKKWFWLTVKLVIALILIALLIRALVYGWVLYVEYRGTTATNDMEEYVSKQYVSHPDGTLAAEYLPSYEELTDYEWVDYYYFDASLARKLFGQYGDSFVVDVKYGEDVYEAKKRAVFSHYFAYDDAAFTDAVKDDIPNETNRHVVAHIESEISYFPYGRALDGFYIEYNDSLCIIRYGFVHRIGYLNVIDLEDAHTYFSNK